MARVTAAEYAAKWGTRLKAAGEDIRRGIGKVAVAPTELAARQSALMLQKVTESVNNGTWAGQLRKVSLQDWQTAALNKGVQRISAGVDAAQVGQTAMAEQLLAAVDASVAEVNKTPRGDLETNIGRAATFSRQMAQRKLRRPTR